MTAEYVRFRDFRCSSRLPQRGHPSRARASPGSRGKHSPLRCSMSRPGSQRIHPVRVVCVAWRTIGSATCEERSVVMTSANNAWRFADGILSKRQELPWLWSTFPPCGWVAFLTGLSDPAVACLLAAHGVVLAFQGVSSIEDVIGDAVRLHCFFSEVSMFRTSRCAGQTIHAWSSGTGSDFM